MKHKEYEFPINKNQWLKTERGISFEEVIAVIEEEGVLEVIPHPNIAKYPNQNMYILNINNYVYLVPFVRKTKNIVYLKTIFPSRKLIKHYLRGGNHEKT